MKKQELLFSPRRRRRIRLLANRFFKNTVKLSKQYHALFVALVVFGFLVISSPLDLTVKQVLSASDKISVSTNPSFEDFHLVIPKLNLQVPIISDVDGSDKEAYFRALENGVAHFKGTAKPDEGSNIFIFGHSSFYQDRPGNYKEIFKDLEQLKEGDEIILWYEKKEFRYSVSEIKIINPTQVEVLRPTSYEQVSLMTCVPPGTTLKRLIVIGQRQK